MDLLGVVTGAASATAAWVTLAVQKKDRRAEEMRELRAELTEAIEKHAANSTLQHQALSAQVTEMLHTATAAIAAQFIQLTGRVDGLYLNESRRRQGDDD